MAQPPIPPWDDKITDYAIKYDRLWRYAYRDLDNRLEDPGADLEEFLRFMDRWLRAQLPWRDFLSREAWKAWRAAQAKYLDLLRAKIYYRTLTWDDRSVELRELEREKRKIYQELIAGIRTEIAVKRKELYAIGLPPKVAPPPVPPPPIPVPPPPPLKPEPAIITITRVETIPPPTWLDKIPWGCRLIFRTDKPAWVRYQFRRPGVGEAGYPLRWWTHAAFARDGTEYKFELQNRRYARDEFEIARAYSGKYEFRGTAWDTIARETTYGTRIVTFEFV